MLEFWNAAGHNQAARQCVTQFKDTILYAQLLFVPSWLFQTGTLRHQLVSALLLPSFVCEQLDKQRQGVINSVSESLWSKSQGIVVEHICLRMSLRTVSLPLRRGYTGQPSAKLTKVVTCRVRGIKNSNERSLILGPPHTGGRQSMTIVRPMTVAPKGKREQRARSSVTMRRDNASHSGNVRRQDCWHSSSGSASQIAIRVLGAMKTCMPHELRETVKRRYTGSKGLYICTPCILPRPLGRQPWALSSCSELVAVSAVSVRQVCGFLGTSMWPLVRVVRCLCSSLLYSFS